MSNKKTNADNLENVVNNLAGSGFVNTATGMGTSKSKLSYNSFVMNFINNWEEYEAAYLDNWIVRRIVDGKAEDATREWREINSENAQEIRNEEKRLHLRSKIKEALIWARLYGGAGILMLTNQDLSQPLNINLIKKGSLENLIVLDRFDLNSQAINNYDITAPNYLLPEHYTISQSGQNIHHSHIIRFEGALLPRRIRLQTQGWGDSELRRCLSDIKETVSSKTCISELMQEANVDVITNKNLSDNLIAGEEKEITKRYEMYSLMKSVFNMALLDGSETYDRKTLNLTGVSDTIEVMMTWLAGCAGYPLTKLFGTSAKGMNATGQGDKDNYNEDLRGIQQKLEMPMTLIDEILVRSATGEMPADFSYSWNPLTASDQVEEAQASLLQAQKDEIYLNDRVIKVSQIKRKLQADDSYQFDEEEIQELEDMENSNMFDIPTDENGNLLKQSAETESV